MTECLYHVFYRSTGRFERFSRDCAAILEVARARNDALGLSGFLHCEDGMFFQWLEGGQNGVEAVCRSLESDPRHSNMFFLSRGPVQSRAFSSWSMGFSTHEDASLHEYLAESHVSARDAARYNAVLKQFLCLRAA